MRPETKVIAMRYARLLCVKRLIRKVRKYGKVMIEVTVVDNTGWYTERRAVDDAIREERGK